MAIARGGDAPEQSSAAEPVGHRSEVLQAAPPEDELRGLGRDEVDLGGGEGDGQGESGQGVVGRQGGMARG